MICTRMSCAIDWPFSMICLGFKKCLDGKGMYEKYCVMVRLLNNGHFGPDISIKKLQGHQFCVAQVVPWYFDSSQVKAVTDQ